MTATEPAGCALCGEAASLRHTCKEAPWCTTCQIRPCKPKNKGGYNQRCVECGDQMLARVRAYQASPEGRARVAAYQALIKQRRAERTAARKAAQEKKT